MATELPTCRILRPNLTRVHVGDVALWFSYETLVAFAAPWSGRVVSENCYSNMTGKHINEIDGGDRAGRLPRAEFEAAYGRHVGDAFQPATKPVDPFAPDTPPGILADWLDDHGLAKVAEAVRREAGV